VWCRDHADLHMSVFMSRKAVAKMGNLSPGCSVGSASQTDAYDMLTPLPESLPPSRGD
jgi:hypothetical protein